jgi:hypothetical protein
MVADEHVHPGGTRGGDLVDGRDRAVGGDQQARAAGGQALDGRGRQAVAVLRAAGQKPVDVGAERAQHADEDRRRADAVDVVVAVDRDPAGRVHVLEHERGGDVHPGEGRRIVALVGGKPGAGGVRLAQAAAHEHLRDRVADAEVALEREDGIHVAGGDLQLGGLGRHARDGTSAARRTASASYFRAATSPPISTSESTAGTA